MPATNIDDISTMKERIQFDERKLREMKGNYANFYRLNPIEKDDIIPYKPIANPIDISQRVDYILDTNDRLKTV